MVEERDLLPWILGTVLLTAGAMAVAIHGSDSRPHAAEASPAPPSAPAFEGPVEERFTVKLAAVPTPTTAPDPDPAAAAAARTGAMAPRGIAAPPAPEALAAGQVWQCTVGGHKIFSDQPCGRDAEVRQLGEINTMQAPPPRAAYSGYPAQYPRAGYPAQYPAEYPAQYPAAPAYATPAPDAASGDDPAAANADAPPDGFWGWGYWNGQDQRWRDHPYHRDDLRAHDPPPRPTPSRPAPSRPAPPRPALPMRGLR